MEGALDDPTRMHKFADSLRRETGRLSTLITEIIQLSRVETSNILAKAKPANVGVVVREALERTLVIADAKDIVVNAKYPDDVFVMGDGELLTVAVKNLVENAIQYSDRKQSVGIGVTTRNGHVDIIVTDQGVGIPADEQSRVFERFYRVDESRDRTTGGTGLGLSLVKHIALSHRGEVTLFSQPGVGSTFTMRLPRLVGLSRALDLVLTGRAVSAREALEMGLANRVVPDGTARTAAVALAQALVELPWACLMADRRSTVESQDLSVDAGLRFEIENAQSLLTALVRAPARAPARSR
jgi:anti-sigma regulatory factor (Ser/Thr protein kinase)